jgi:cobalamin synthase
MFDVPRITTFSAKATDAAGSTVRMIRAQPNWLIRLLALVFVIVVVLPFALLLIVVVLVAAVAIAALAGVRAAINRLRGLLPRDDGRSNVRVVRRVD